MTLSGYIIYFQLLKFVESILQENGEQHRHIEYYFEDLPTSDFNELVGTIHKSNLSEQFYPMIIGKSFYEKLFPPASVDLCLSLLECPIAPV